MSSTTRLEAPRGLLRRQASRRLAVVIAAALVLALLVSPSALDDYGLVMVIAVAAINVMLGHGTGRLASARAGELDERQEALRNKAYRLAYRSLAAVGLVAVLLLLPGRPGVGARQVVALLAIAVYLPGAMVAWLAPDAVDDEDREPGGDTRALRAGTVARIAILLAPFIWSLGVVLPARVTSTTTPYQRTPACSFFGAHSEVGYGIGATVPLAAEVCWDGHAARESWGLNASDCNLASSAMATGTTTECSRQVAADGTLRFRYGVRVQPTLLPFVHRDVTVELVVRGDGTVVRFPN
jgi:hypothetical protein